MSTPVEAFIIHLARAEARRPQVDHLLAACPVPARIVDAVDGRALPVQEIDTVYTRKSLHAPSYPFDMTVGEVGCFLSHRKAWQAILDAGLDVGLVIEDDVEMDAAEFARALELARAHVASHGIVQFQVRQIAEPGPVIASAGDIVLTRPVIIPLRASCTLYSRAALELLLAQTTRFDRPIDGHVQLHWVTGLRPLIVIPSGVRDKGATIGGTTIQARNVPLLRRIRRELLRPIYRYRIAALSRGNDQPSG
ncbi:glycosyltransferase involved in LPS biosynthesis [Hoeflea sp. IMCC20628]|uniref:glycosyltransferase family 25 protein n=1 Tax=Hoeflea sp. IMCC20628 TaxID=1620421 RepID=UPI00063ADDE0|nr:glycosyltransferase family 25 protein [Hoeflea sp. IMCC20628]AKI02420.1 glycosyltransferase involved in LPS biosynthesis [Hoeflea sp. IMCC20628]